ncbi:formyltransferase family protein [Flammeovirga pacifica]|nr:formyltransferase family protein [Flammeovirga pacifica]
MTQKGYNTLVYISEKYLDIIGIIIIGTDKKIKNDFSSEIIEHCKIYNIKYTLDKNYSSENLSIAISWRWLINTNDLIVLHDSLLPKYRGFSPLVNMLINGEERIGVTAIFANDEFDKGDIIYQASTDINYPIKIQEAINEISKCYNNTIEYIFLEKLNNRIIFGKPQIEKDATYSLWRNEDDYFIDWNNSAKKIKRTIDALGSPFDGAKTFLSNNIVTIKEAEVIEDVKIENRDNGKVLFKKGTFPVVVCNEGLLMIKSIIDSDKNELLPLKQFRIRFK